MSMAAFFFPRKTSNRRRDAAALELKVQVRTVINADDCGGARTTVLIMHPRRTTDAVEIDKPLEQITQSDLTDALAPFVAQTGWSELHPQPK